ncbi:hypothetical protein WJX84_010303 [Apatococcus fuscideae]|uniref:Uncharacterized protein n=1 Tax=Apatococcus fuscideae TaxID=2026836 RepID=A0AAW1RVE4_9CHLO
MSLFPNSLHLANRVISVPSSDLLQFLLQHVSQKFGVLSRVDRAELLVFNQRPPHEQVPQPHLRVPVAALHRLHSRPGGTSKAMELRSRHLPDASVSNAATGLLAIKSASALKLLPEVIDWLQAKNLKGSALLTFKYFESAAITAASDGSSQSIGVLAQLRCMSILQFDSISSQVAIAAALHGQVSVLKFLAAQHLPFPWETSQMAFQAAGVPQWPVLKWMQERGMLGRHACELITGLASLHGDCTLLAWILPLAEEKLEISAVELALHLAISHGRMKVVKWLDTQEHGAWSRPGLCQTAAKAGSLEMMVYLRTREPAGSCRKRCGTSSRLPASDIVPSMGASGGMPGDLWPAVLSAGQGGPLCLGICPWRSCTLSHALQISTHQGPCSRGESPAQWAKASYCKAPCQQYPGWAALHLCKRQSWQGMYLLQIELPGNVEGRLLT